LFTTPRRKKAKREAVGGGWKTLAGGTGKSVMLYQKFPATATPGSGHSKSHLLAKRLRRA